MTVLLDIDGVMVSGASWKVPDLMEDGFYVFLQPAVQRLVSLNPSHIVITSSHRNRYSIEEWKKIFETRNIIVDQISKLETSNLSRKDQILD